MAKEADGAQMNAAKLKALQATIDKIEKDYGKGTIMKLGDQPEWDASQVIPSGSIALDHALGIGGYPKGRIVEIYGPESSGKTTLAIHAIAQAQKTGGIAAIIDAEHAFDRTYAKSLGVNLDTLLISQPDNGEQALEIADNLIRSGAVDIVVIAQRSRERWETTKWASRPALCHRLSANSPQTSPKPAPAAFSSTS